MNLLDNIPSTQKCICIWQNCMSSSIFDIHIPANDHKASQTAHSHGASREQHREQMEIIQPIQNSAPCSNMKIVASEY